MEVDVTLMCIHFLDPINCLDPQLTTDLFAQPLAIGSRIVYADPAPGTNPPPAGSGLLGNSSMVELRTLTPSILVRIQVPQPIFVINQINNLAGYRSWRS